MESYSELINSILETRGRFACGDVYHERHHILPRCMQGTDDEDNLIDLFAKEHFEAHKLLALENPNNEKLVHAWWCMSTMQNEYEDRYQITAEEYEEARIYYAQLMKEKMSGNNNPMANRPWWDKNTSQEKIDCWKNNIVNSIKERWSDPEFKERMCHQRKGTNCGELNPMYGRTVSQETRDKIRKKSKEYWQDPKYKDKMMEHFIGESNPFYGKHHTDESIQKIKAAKGIPIVQLDSNGKFIAEYICATEAEKYTNATSIGIRRCCQGKQETSGGYRWKDKSDWEKENNEI